MSTLSRILHVAHGIPSYHNSLLGLAERLHRSGIELLVVSHNDLSSVLAETGHCFVHLRSDTTLEIQRQIAMDQCRQQPPPMRWAKQYRHSRQFRQQSMHTAELRELIERWKPELLLIDMECHKAIIQAYATSIPIVLLSRWYTVFRQGNNPPMHTQLMPASTRTDVIRIRLSWYRLSWYKRWLAFRHSVSRQRFQQISYASNARPALKALAKAHGLDVSSTTDTSQWLIPHVYRDLPVMSFTHEAMEFTPENDSRMRYVGPIVASTDAFHPERDSAIDRLTAFLDARHPIKNPLIYCSLSTFWNTQQDLLGSIVELFAQRQDLDLVMGLGGRHRHASTVACSDNVLLLNYAPQLAVLQQAQLAITHGGVSTINEALLNGVSLIVCSSGHVDQNGCTARVLHHGVGLSCQARPLDILRLETNIDILLSSKGSAIRKNVSAMQARMKHTNQKNLDIRLLQKMADTTCYIKTADALTK